MNLAFLMVDTDTGEVVARKSCNYACSFATKNDAGFRTCMEWIHSCVRGVRTPSINHRSLELRIHFFDDEPLPELPFGMTPQDARALANNYVG